MSAVALLFAGALWAQENPLWMRHCAISPDGTTIAFTYKGDIFTVPVSGGKATQITTNPAFDTTPIWSPDSKQIAFASDRMGSMDVFIVSKDGGEPRRLTTFSGGETPVAFTDAGHILFTADIMPSTEDAGFPSNGQFQQIYQIPVSGGRPVMFSSMPMECISINKEGTILYQDKKDTKITGASIRSHRLPVISGCSGRDRLRATKNRLLSLVKTVNRCGHRTENHFTI